MLFFFSVTCLKCNFCSTYISFEDCIRQQQTTDCHKGYKCGKSHYKYNGTDIYNLSCISDLHCKDPADNMCGVNTYMSDCEVICCNEDLCNAAASSQVVSVSVILACGFSAYAWTMPWYHKHSRIKLTTNYSRCEFFCLVTKRINCNGCLAPSSGRCL